MGVKLDGYAETARLLSELPKRVRKTAARKGVTAGSAPIVKAAKAKAPVETRMLKRSMGRKVKAYRSGNAVAVIGARKGIAATAKQAGRDARAAKRVPANYLHLVTGGTKAHKVGKRSHPGARANNFLKAAYVGQQWTAARLVKDTIAAVVRAEAAKLGKK